MEFVQEKIKNPYIAAGAGFIIGLIIGWFAIGWGLWPVEWEDAAPQHLREDAKEDYLRMVIDAYGQGADVDLTKKRWDELGETGIAALKQIEANPGSQSATAIAGFKNAMGVTAEVVEETEAGSNALLWGACLVTLILGAALVGIYLMRGSRESDELSVQTQATLASKEADRRDFEEEGIEPPLGQFMTTYMIGDDLFDDSFSIESPSGEFLGECGVAIAETIGVGEPKRVTSFEVWLFDKNDVQTVTKVIMSDYAFKDIGTRERLEAKGELILSEPSNQIVLETATLYLIVRVVDMSYYEDTRIAPDSHFERITIELAVWNK